MNVKNNFFSFKEITMRNYKEALNQILSVVGVVLVVAQLIMIVRNPLSGKVNSKLLFHNTLIFVIIVGINIHSLIGKKSVFKLEEVNKNLTEVNDKVRCFKHDFNNIMQAIDGYIVLKDITSLQTYFGSLAKECNHVNIIEFLNNRVKENPAIISILLSKYRVAENKNVSMNIEILFNLSSLTPKSFLISRMLGILLDNAIEASSETKEKFINIKFMKEESKNRVVIMIENSYMNKNLDLDKIFEKDYSTKKSNTGLGLWKIRDILKEDNNLDLFTTKDENMFKQQLEIYG